MAENKPTIIDRFDGGIKNDPRDTQINTARVVTGFDLRDPKRLIPYYDSEDGDSGSATSRKQNFEIALRTGTTYSLYALGVKSGAATAEVLYKDLSTGGTFDLSENTWQTPTANQSSTGATSFNLFKYYKKTGLIYGARSSRYIWAFSPTGTAWDDSARDLTSFTNIAQGLVHSKDDILYIPYDNKICKNDNGSWTDAALTLPSHFYITSICEYGNYLAIACAPLSGVGKSVVYLWDRDSSLTTLSESIDWGEGILKILEESDGILVGISAVGGSSVNIDDRIVFRYLSGGKAKIFEELQGDIGTVSNSFPIAKQKVKERLYFMLAITINGTAREGVWSVGLAKSGGFSIIHERTPNNNTALSSGSLLGFIMVGDYLFQSYISSSAYAVSKTNDQASYTANSIYESKIFNFGDSSLTKQLIGITVMTEYMPTAGQIVLKYMKDEETSWTTIFTNTTNNSISYSAVNLTFQFKEIQFQIISTGGAVVTGLKLKAELIDKDIY